MDKSSVWMYKTRMISTYRAARIRISQYYLPESISQAPLMHVLRAGWLDSLPGGAINRTECHGDDVLYCLSGQGEIRVVRRNFRLLPGQLAWIPGDVPHGHCADLQDPWSLMWFRIDGPELARLRRRVFGSDRFRMTINEAPDLIAWFEVLFKILEVQRPDTDLRMNSAIASLLQLLVRQRDPSIRNTLPTHLDRLVRAISANPALPWTAEDLVRIADKSPSQLRRLFHVHLGTTPRSFIRKQRLMRAQRLMLESSLTLQEVAVECGFSDGYHFSRDFKRLVGRSPTEWRKTETGV